MIFNWLRQRVKSAFLAGLHDAVAELGDGQDADGTAAVQLRLMLTPAQPALPAPEGEPQAAARRGRKEAP